MCKKLYVLASRASNFRSVTQRPERPPSVIPTSRVLWLVAFAVVWTMTGYGGIAIGQVAGVDDPSDMADSSGDIKRIEAWMDEGNLNLTMTVYGVFAPSVEDTPAGMTNRYYYHWLLDTDNNPDTGYLNDEYEGNPTNLQTPIGVDVLVQFGWRDGDTAGVYAYTFDPLTGDEVELFEDYEYTIDVDKIHAVIPLEDLGLDPGQTIALSAYQEGASNDWQVDWIESFELTLTAVARAVLFAEDFEGLALGPNVDEELAGDAVWTDTPPEGWIVDESGIPGIGMDETDGVTEWAGWAFADKAWWIEAAEDQDRSLFELGSGIVAVADPDEWDDAERLPIPIDADPYDTWLTTPEIVISGSEVGTLQLKFDSSWRPEFDSNYHQTASVTASYDDGEPVVVMLWESDEASDNYHPYATNETVIVNLDNPAGARRLVLTFGLYDAGNDWWWAIDNLEVSGIVQGLEPVDPGADGLVAFYALDGDANDSSGNGNDGTISNAETGGLGDGGSVWVDDPERGTVISFNGTAEGAFVRAGDIPQMTLTNDFTWAFWAKHNAENTADNDIIVGNRMDENPADFVPRQFIKFTPTKFEWHMNGNGDDNLDYEDIPADVWLHHAVVKTADQLTYYRNGVEAASGTFTQPMDFPQPLYFGGDNEAAEGENWSGLMSEVAIYGRALSVGEVRYLAGERAGDPSLVIYYDFDDVGDIVTDQSGKGHDGVVVGEVTAEANGMYGGAANFANGGYLDLDGPSIPAEDIPTSAMTLAAWINMANTGGDHEIFNARASDETWVIHPEPKSSGDIRWLLRSYGGATIFQIRAGTITWDEWLHFAGTYDKESGKAALYINGELIEELVVENPVDIAGDWGMGARVGLTIDNGRPFTGLMDEFRMYTRALSQDDVMAIIQGP